MKNLTFYFLPLLNEKFHGILLCVVTGERYFIIIIIIREGNIWWQNCILLPFLMRTKKYTAVTISSSLSYHYRRNATKDCVISNHTTLWFKIVWYPGISRIKTSFAQARANKWVQRSARAKWAVRSKLTSEGCEQTSRRTSEWPIWTSGCS